MELLPSITQEKGESAESGAQTFLVLDTKKVWAFFFRWMNTVKDLFTKAGEMSGVICCAMLWLGKELRGDRGGHLKAETRKQKKVFFETIVKKVLPLFFEESLKEFQVFSPFVTL